MRPHPDFLSKTFGFFEIRAKAQFRMGDSGAAVLFQLHQADAGKVALKENEGRARRSAETINRLIGVSNRKDVAFFPGQPLQNFHLGEIYVLKFVHQDEPAARPQRRSFCCNSR